MNKQLLLKNEDKITVDVLQHLRDHPKKTPKIADWQREFGLGYARACRIFDLLVSAGIISERKYKMLLGEDGKLHKEYLPKRTLVSVKELNDCIKYIAVNKKEGLK